MQFREFIGQVQHKAHLATQEDAIKATRATLQTLSERLPDGEANDLAASLPEEIGSYLKRDRGVERFSLDDFFKRISDREQEDLPDAVFHARAVFDVLRSAVPGGEMRHVQAQLPEEFKGLFSGSEGRFGS